MHVATRVRMSRVVRLELITSLYSGSSIQNASEQFVSCIQLSFYLPSSFSPSNETAAGLSLKI
jgi:hypothetical protein